jgi:hypothetical protein
MSIVAPPKIVRNLTREDQVVFGSMLLTLGGIICGAVFAAPLAFGVTALLVLGLLILGQLLTHSPRLAWLLLAGIVAGALELWADWVHVIYTQTLVYTDYFGFRLVASPSYMPIGWCVTVVQFGYLALRLRERWSPWQVIAALTLIGLLLPPWYEELAAPAHAWYYRRSGPMLSHTPLWIIGTYAGCMFFVASATLVLYEQRGWGRALLAGIFIGAGLLLSGVAWYSVLGQ